MPALAVATAELSGCPLVRFSIGGRPQPALASVSGSQILAITGLRHLLATASRISWKASRGRSAR